MVTNISWVMLFNSNLKALGSAPYICGITATLKYIMGNILWLYQGLFIICTPDVTKYSSKEEDT